MRIEDVALGCAVSAIVGILFWPRGAASVMGDNLALALRSGADYLTESAHWALELGEKHPDHAITAIGAGSRLDDAIRGYLTEQGSKRIAKQDLWVLVMAAQRIRLTAHSLASLSVRQHSAHQRAAARRPVARAARAQATYSALVTWNSRSSTTGSPPRSARPATSPAEVTEVTESTCRRRSSPTESAADRIGSDPDAIWVSLHLEQLSPMRSACPARPQAGPDPPDAVVARAETQRGKARSNRRRRE